MLPSTPPPFPPRATAGRVIGAASQQQRALFYPLPPYLLSYTPPYYPLLPAILSTASNLIHLIKLADLEGRPLCLPIIAIAPVFSAFGKDPATKSDEFLEKFQTAFDPPPLIFGKLCCKFFIMDMVAFMQGGIGQIVSVNINNIS